MLKSALPDKILTLGVQPFLSFITFDSNKIVGFIAPPFGKTLAILSKDTQTGLT